MSPLVSPLARPLVSPLVAPSPLVVAKRLASRPAALRALVCWPASALIALRSVLAASRLASPLVSPLVVLSPLVALSRLAVAKPPVNRAAALRALVCWPASGRTALRSALAASRLASPLAVSSPAAVATSG